jgi:hypothetical protein
MLAIGHGDVEVSCNTDGTACEQAGIAELPVEMVQTWVNVTSGPSA